MSESFSFTSLRLTMPISGVGNNVVIGNGDHQFSAQSDNYSGSSSGNPALLQVATLVPEPAAFAWALGLGMALLCGRRALRAFST